MSTRGTYDINGTRFYCHWDNGPDGAAARFLSMAEANVRPTDRDDYRCLEYGRGGLAFAFIRGNFDAETFEGGDTQGAQYHYTLTASTTGAPRLTVHERDNDWQWFAAESLPLRDFINRHRPGHVVLVNHQPGFTLATTENADAIAANLEAMAARYDMDSPSRREIEARAQAWREAVNAATLHPLKRNDYPRLTEPMLEAMAGHMCDELRERIHSEWRWDHPGQFLTEYMIHDADFPLHQFDIGERS
jgi:hypothetical protein